jgi:tRNA-uridine 2-sulfurtransferase
MSVVRKKVLLGMSGGLDSSVAAILLQRSGYEVVGGTFRTWDYISESCISKNTGCCSIETIHEASEFAKKMGIDHHVLDFRTEFKSIVIDNFVEEYAKGRTPNPCVVCNSHIKWGLMLKTAAQLGCSHIATGHYAGVRNHAGRFVLKNAADTVKDQTYFLWQLTSQQLSKTLFPLSGLTKAEVREIAKQHGFNTLSAKRESQEICFVPDNNYRAFIEKEYPQVFEKSQIGEVIDIQGKVLGKHKGCLHHTIGQRKGLGIAVGEPVYIVDIQKDANVIVVGKKDDLLSNTLRVSNINFTKYEKPPHSLIADVKIRYNTSRVPATIEADKKGLIVRFHQAVSAVTPGQSAVFYEQDECIGGGIIEGSIK